MHAANAIRPSKPARTALVFASVHGHTKKIVQAAVARLGKKVRVFHASDRRSLAAFDRFLFFCPTYGDEELAADMEAFLTRLRLRRRRFAVCEVGNYYGYEDPEFGPRGIFVPFLRKLGWREFFRPVSVDSVPVIDWDRFEEWIDALNRFLDR